MKILHLTLKNKWFDMIASGEKKEEYRELKDYWRKRLLSILDEGDKILYRPSKMYDIVRFRNGYAKNSPSIDVKFKGCEITTGFESWGAEPGKEYFVIKLGDKIKTTNHNG
jgi:hypothetical protein